MLRLRQVDHRWQERITRKRKSSKKRMEMPAMFKQTTRETTGQPVRSEEENDNVNHPKHYTKGGIEAIDAIEAAVIGLYGCEASHTANAIKYLWRWKHKGGVEDLRKAVWYINRLIAKEEGM